MTPKCSIRRSTCSVILASALVLATLTACGFRPLYGEQSASAVSREELAAVQIDLIRDREGQMLRNELLDRFQPSGAAPKPLYGLSIGLAIQRVGLAIQRDEIGTRANLIMVANYAVRDLANGEVLFSGTSRSVTGYNVLDSEFATTIGDTDAIRRTVFDLSEQITTRVSVVLAERKSASR